MNVFEKYPEFREQSWRGSQTMSLIAGVNGEVYDANNAFLSWIGYARHEFVRTENPVTWDRITLPDADLETDLAEAQRCLEGKTTHYSIRKHYIPKGQLPHLIELHVMRWPLVGEFEFFYCEVFDLKNGSKRAFEELQELQIETTRSIGGMTTLIQESVDLAKSSPARKIVDWFVSNQKISIPFALLIVFLLFGRSAIEVVKQAFDLFYGNSE